MMKIIITKRGAILRAQVEPHILQKNFGCHMTVRMSICLCQAQYLENKRVAPLP